MINNFDPKNHSSLDNYAKWLLQSNIISDLESLQYIGNTIVNFLDKELQLLKITIDKQVEDQKIERAIIDNLMSENYEERKSAGLDDNYTQYTDLVKNILVGNKEIEIQTVGPYATLHFDEHKNKIEFDYSKMSLDEIAGLELAKYLKKIFRLSRAHMKIVALLDDFNFSSNLPISQLEYSDKYTYLANVTKVLSDYQIIEPHEKPGIDYILILESEQVSKINELIQRLKISLNGKVVASKESTRFYPSDDLIKTLRLSESTNEELKKHGIVLIKNDTPTCTALDTCTFLGNQNKFILHLIILPQKFNKQQDKVYSLLRALDITTPNNFHNSFFDISKFTKEALVYVFLNNLRREFQRVLNQIN
jgi:hypothetical protein